MLSSSRKRGHSFDDRSRAANFRCRPGGRCGPCRSAGRCLRSPCRTCETGTAPVRRSPRRPRPARWATTAAAVGRRGCHVDTVRVERVGERAFEGLPVGMASLETPPDQGESAVAGVVAHHAQFTQCSEHPAGVQGTFQFRKFGDGPGFDQGFDLFLPCPEGRTAREGSGARCVALGIRNGCPPSAVLGGVSESRVQTTKGGRCQVSPPGTVPGPCAAQGTARPGGGGGGNRGSGLRCTGLRRPRSRPAPRSSAPLPPHHAWWWCACGRAGRR